MMPPVVHGASLSVEPAAAYSGANGLRVTLDNTDPALVTDESPDAAGTYELRFFINVENLAPGTGESFDVLRLLDVGAAVEVRLAVVEDAGGVELRYAVSHTGDPGAGILIDEDASLEGGWKAVHLSWQAGSGDGAFELAVGDQVLTGLTGLDNNSGEVTSVQWGAVAGVDAGTSGSFDLDDFESRLEGLVAPPFLRLANISTRLFVGDGDEVGIAGFIVTGDTEKTVLIRGRGPSLAPFGLSGLLADPRLQLFQGQTELLSNDDWADSQQSEIEATGIAPTDADESAILVTLAPGPYTAILSGVGATTGLGIVEAFDVDETGTPTELYNISTRGPVQTGDEVMIGGFIIQGPSPETVIIRAIGPSLAGAGVPGVLSDPTLTIFEAQTQIGFNDDWQDSQEASIEAAGLAPNDSRESAIILTLDPGPYTAIVRGAGNSTGVGLVEVFNIDN